MDSSLPQLSNGIPISIKSGSLGVTVTFDPGLGMRVVDVSPESQLGKYLYKGDYIVHFEGLNLWNASIEQFKEAVISTSTKTDRYLVYRPRLQGNVNSLTASSNTNANHNIYGTAPASASTCSSMVSYPMQHLVPVNIKNNTNQNQQFLPMNYSYNNMGVGNYNYNAAGMVNQYNVYNHNNANNNTNIVDSSQTTNDTNHQGQQKQQNLQQHPHSQSQPLTPRDKEVDSNGASKDGLQKNQQEQQKDLQQQQHPHSQSQPLTTSDKKVDSNGASKDRLQKNQQKQQKDLQQQPQSQSQPLTTSDKEGDSNRVSKDRLQKNQQKQQKDLQQQQQKQQDLQQRQQSQPQPLTPSDKECNSNGASKDGLQKNQQQHPQSQPLTPTIDNMGDKDNNSHGFQQKKEEQKKQQHPQSQPFTPTIDKRDDSNGASTQSHTASNNKKQSQVQTKSKVEKFDYSCKCDICDMHDGYRGMYMQRCKQCGIYVHEECYCLLNDEHKGVKFPNWQCWACLCKLTISY